MRKLTSELSELMRDEKNLNDKIAKNLKAIGFEL